MAENASTPAAVAVLFAVAVVLYVVAGYPLVLAALVRVRPGHPPVRRHWLPLVTVLLPVRNGELWLAAKLDSILALEYPPTRLEVLVVDDGSSDLTRSIAARYAPRGITLIKGDGRGKAHALNLGLECAHGEVVFFTDVRQRLDPAALRVLVEYLADPSVGAVSGELIICAGKTEEEAQLGLYWRYEKWIRSHLSQLDSVLGATGCVYAMRRSLTAPLPQGLLVDDMYLPLLAFFKGYRVLFTSEARAYDYPTGLETEFWRKVRTLAGNYQLLRYFPQLLLPTNRMWFHYVSHKLGRLVLPFALVAVASLTPWLPGPLALAAIAAQVTVYVPAAIDCLVPDESRLKRISSAARTFVVLMAAALAATSIVLVGSRGFWRQTTVRHTKSA